MVTSPAATLLWQAQRHDCLNDIHALSLHLLSLGAGRVRGDVYWEVSPFLHPPGSLFSGPRLHPGVSDWALGMTCALAGVTHDVLGL